MTREAARQAPPGELRSDYVAGLGLLILGAIAFSSAGFFVRLIGHDSPTILFWRGIFTALTVLLYVVWREGRGTWASFCGMGLPGIAVSLLSTISMICFVTSLQYTTVANNSIIFGTAPFLTAGLAWFLIRERPTPVTLLFSGVALVGALLVVGSSLQVAGGSALGDALAFGMTLSFAIKTVLLRQYRDRPMLPSGCIGALVGSILTAPFALLTITWQEIGLFALFGLTQQGAGVILTTLGIARVPAAQSALILTLDLPLSPVWVWSIFGERPTAMALLGGMIVLAAIIGHIVLDGRRRPFG